MKKISVVYWSNGGNVEVLAEAISRGAKEGGAEVNVKLVSLAKVEDIISADAVALGSPSMDNDSIEQHEMEPFIKEFKLLPNGNKPLVLFGSYGWDNGKFMEDWVERMNDYGFNVIGNIAVKEAPNKLDIEKAEEFGRQLSK